MVKTGATSTWVVLRPDRSLGVLDTCKRATTSGKEGPLLGHFYGTTSGKESLYWAPGAVLSEAEKTRYEVEARALVEQGRADRPRMVGHMSGQVALAQVGALLLAGAPWRALRSGALWALRTRRRAAGTCILVFMIYFMLEEFGIFAVVGRWMSRFQAS